MFYNLLPPAQAHHALLNCFEQTNEEFALSTPDSWVKSAGVEGGVILQSWAHQLGWGQESVQKCELNPFFDENFVSENKVD